MIGKTTREYPKTEELREAAKEAFSWQGTYHGAFTKERGIIVGENEKGDFFVCRQICERT